MKLSTFLSGYKTYAVSVMGAAAVIGSYLDHQITLGNLEIGLIGALSAAMIRAGSKSDAQAAATAVIASTPTATPITAELADAVGQLVDKAAAVSGSSSK